MKKGELIPVPLKGVMVEIFVLSSHLPLWVAKVGLPPRGCRPRNSGCDTLGGEQGLAPREREGWTKGKDAPPRGASGGGKHVRIGDRGVFRGVEMRTSGVAMGPFGGVYYRTAPQ